MFRRLTSAAAYPAVLGGVVGAAVAAIVLDPGSNVSEVLMGAGLVAAIGLGVAISVRGHGEEAWHEAVESEGDNEGPVSQVDRQAEAAQRFLRAAGLALLFPQAGGRFRVGAVAGTTPAGVDVGAEVDPPPGVAALGAGRPSVVDRPEELLGRSPGSTCTVGLLAVGGATTAMVVGWFPGRRVTPGQQWRMRRMARGAAGAIERARLDDAERRSRLGASHARRHLSLLV
ncbi:MAG TPA: hypothetical protein VGI06_17045, partial [Acidimicrobiales bacterium]